MSKWANVKIPITLAKQVDTVLDTGGFTSRSSLVQDAIRRRIDELKEKKDLTDVEKRMLDAWARHRNDLRSIEEADLGDLLLAENSHVWSWLRGKLAHCVEYILKLRSNRN